MAYNKERTEMLAWGDKALEHQNIGTDSDFVYMDNFMEELYRVYPKYKADINDKDALWVLQGVTDYILNLVNNLKTKYFETVEHENVNAINSHFAFVIPTEWEYSIRQDVLRPMFVATGLISTKDHPNRLLFFTKLQSILLLIQHPKFGINERIKRVHNISCVE